MKWMISLYLLVGCGMLHAQNSFPNFETAFTTVEPLILQLRSGDFIEHGYKPDAYGFLSDSKLQEYVTDLADTAIDIQYHHSMVKSHIPNLYYYQECAYKMITKKQASYYYITGILMEVKDGKAKVDKNMMATDHDGFQLFWSNLMKYCKSSRYGLIPERYNVAGCPPNP